MNANVLKDISSLLFVAPSRNSLVIELPFHDGFFFPIANRTADGEQSKEAIIMQQTAQSYNFLISSQILHLVDDV